MRKIDQVLQNKEVVDKILQGYHFGYFKRGSVSWNDKDKNDKLRRKQKMEDELLLTLKIYKFSADNVREIAVSIDEDYRDTSKNKIDISERFDTGVNKWTTLYMDK